MILAECDVRFAAEDGDNWRGAELQGLAMLSGNDATLPTRLLQTVGISYILQRGKTVLGLSRPRKCLT
jgi:hypothetical protein